MKKLLLFVSMFIACSGLHAQGVWVTQNTGFSSVSSGIRNISVVDTSVVWVTPYDGDPGSSGLPRQDYSRTVDGGATWVADTVPTSSIWDWSMIYALDDSNAWAVFFNSVFLASGQIWHTSNGGATWTQQGAGSMYINTTDGFPNVIHFWNDTDGVVIGDPVNGEYEIYTTTNGGTNWTIVPGVNIPNPLSATEAGWTTHIEVVGDNVWFDTNHGRVYHSSDRGYTWTVSATGLPAPIPGSIDICFYNDSSGIARYYNDTTLTSYVVETSDGGATWSAPFVPMGDFFGADVKAVPGEDSMIVSTGVSSTSGYTGSSYSLNGGHSWTTIESGTQRNALGIADSLTMWCGGFTASPTSGGIFKWVVIEPVACTDTSISPGVTTASDTALCGGDTLTVTTTGAYGPVSGDFSGISWAISSADITGSLNPLLEASFVASYVITFPAPSTHFRNFINDGTLIDGFTLPYGTYYWTPVVFGNATAATSPVTFLQDLNLSNNCTFTGNSIAVNILNPANCNLTGIQEVTTNQLAVNASMLDRNTLDLRINSSAHGKVNLQIVDLTGRVVNESSFYVAKGSNREMISVEKLSAGTYIIKAEVNGNRAANKIVKY
jgi:hypothetical protein